MKHGAIRCLFYDALMHRSTGWFRQFRFATTGYG
jgi:hypothetical protein